MYGKVFEDIFCSTLMDYGGDTAYVFMAMIVLSDEQGIIKHTENSLARLICKPVEVVSEAIKNLEQQDQKSNIKAHQGRRIIRLFEIMDDETRGWLVVNKSVYRDRASLEDKRKADRERIAEKRSKNNDVAECRDMSRSVANVAYTDTDTDTKKQGRTVVLPDWVPHDAWEAWLEVRSKAKAPNTPRALRLALTELAKLKAAGSDPRAVLETAVVRGWRGLFAVKPDTAQPIRADL